MFRNAETRAFEVGRERFRNMPVKPFFESKNRTPSVRETRREKAYEKKRWRWSGVGDFDVPTRTAPTNGWSRTHRTAILAMLTPPWRSPILRNTESSRWKRVQSPHTRVIASRYCHCFQKKNTRREKGGAERQRGDCRTRSIAIARA
jgi:hypothetical protein